ncbi:hypothetical protein O181_026832 [Austropuccinia psidii MF-1]|uniref:Reverse transcriptase domain-containing protein n=1 Tax=Austropuccinia psidii MF-1 TaxID=1389203 RepID=A0A9Q3CNU0_9BASI|nr:hypothetical protein [Austropuccinia psidii MF-1]
MSWLLEHKDRLTNLNPDRSGTMVHKMRLRKCGGDLEHAIRSRYIEHLSTKDYIIAIEDITKREKRFRYCYKPPTENNISGEPISREKPNKPQYRDLLKFQKCGSKSHFSNIYPRKEGLMTKSLKIMEKPKKEMKPYPPLSRRKANPETPRAREELEFHIDELMKLGVLQSFGHNEEVEVTAPVIDTQNNDKSRIVGDFRAFNTYRISQRYPISRIHETLSQLYKASFITSMDAPKGFHQSFLTPHFRKLLKIIAYCGIYKYLRIPSEIKNSPAHYRRIHKSGNINKDFDGLSIWASPNTSDNPSYPPENSESQIQIEVIDITDLGEGFSEEAR